MSIERRGSRTGWRAVLVSLIVLLASANGAVAHRGESVGPDDRDGREDRGITRELAGVRAATRQFRDVSAAQAAGYGAFYICTDREGVGAMGQHFVNGELVGDPAIDAFRPEIMVYAPRRDGGYRLVAVEWVVFQDAWLATHADPPSLFGQAFQAVGSPNRYGLPPFFELHAWIWKANPLGVFNDWNPRVSCLGQGDPA